MKKVISSMLLVFLFAGCGTGQGSEVRAGDSGKIASGSSSTGPETHITPFLVPCPSMQDHRYGPTVLQAAESDILAALEECEAFDQKIEKARAAGLPVYVTNQKLITLRLNAFNEHAEFECSQDDGSYASCGSYSRFGVECNFESDIGTTPMTCVEQEFGPFADGKHTLRVQAVDGTGRKDPTPALAQWTIDAFPPSFEGALRGEKVPISKYCPNDENTYQVLLHLGPATDNRTSQGDLRYKICTGRVKGACQEENSFPQWDYRFCRRDSRSIYVRDPDDRATWPRYIKIHVVDEAGNWDTNTTEICIPDVTGYCP